MSIRGKGFKVLMLIVFVLVGLIAFAACCTAFADETIAITSPSSGSVVSGKSSLSVTWSSVDGADYYLFSARNLTNDTTIVSRVDMGTSQKYRISAGDLPFDSSFRFWVGAFTYDGTQLAGSDTGYIIHTNSEPAPEIIIDGSFRKSRYSMEVGDTLSIAVNASAQNAELTRVTINVDSSGNDRLASTSVSGTSWSGSLTLSSADAPLNVPGTYTIKLFVGVSEGEPNWAQVDKATLTVKESTACAHAAVGEYWMTSNGYSLTYKSISDTQHTVSGYKYRSCNDCYERIGDVYADTSTEAHQFDKAGDCLNCGYTASCQHRDTQPRIDNSGYTSKGEEGHLFVQYGYFVCTNANCGKETDPYYAETMQNHSFNGDSCSLCGYTKAKEMSVTVSRGQSSAETNEMISATASVQGGSGAYNFAWEVLCNGTVVRSTDYSMPASYSYVADQTGTWKFKVYVQDQNTGEVIADTSADISVETAVCPHDLTTSIQQGTPQYIKSSDTKHEIRTTYNKVCTICQKTINNYYDSKYEAHNLDASGKCVCGYTAPIAGCSHTASTSKQIGKPMIKPYDEKWHEIVTVFQDICANQDCQTVLTERREKREKIAHRFDENGNCACGYALPTKDCDHATTKTKLNSQAVPVNADSHHTTVTYHYECACGQVSYDKATESDDLHVFVGRACRECGYEKKCDHSDFEKVISSEIKKNKDSETTHYVILTHADTCECGAANPIPIERQTVECDFKISDGIQALHEDKGHQYFDRCACGRTRLNGEYKAFLKSCPTCAELYGNSPVEMGTYNSAEVKRLQEMLNEAGFALTVDGDFGPKTEKAIKAFQKENGLDVTGVADDATWAALRGTMSTDNVIDSVAEQERVERLNELINSIESAPNKYETFAKGGAARNYLTQMTNLKSRSAFNATNSYVLDDFADGGIDLAVKGAYKAATSDGLASTVVELHEDQNDRNLELMIGLVKELISAYEPNESSELAEAVTISIDIFDEVATDSTLVSEPLAQYLAKNGMEPKAAAARSAYITGTDKEVSWEKGKVSNLKYGLTAASVIVECIDIGVVSHKQKEALLESVVLYGDNMQALDRIIDSSTGTLCEAAKYVQKELEEAYLGQFRNILGDAHKKLALTAGDAIAGVFDPTSFIRAVFKAGTHEQGRHQKAEFAFVEYTFALSAIQTDCANAIRDGDQGAYDLLRLYGLSLEKGFNNAYEYYDSFGKTLGGKVTTLFGGYDGDQILSIIRKQSNELKQIQAAMEREMK